MTFDPHTLLAETRLGVLATIKKNGLPQLSPGSVTLTGPAADPHGPEVEALVDYYRSAAGEHPDWDEYRSVMVSDRRVLMALTVDRVYGEKIR
ncbi:hypothetical protein [Mycobacterium sp.]|uniref:hypothetical protein n=1 Tax=Mycobacterium sp. TaxID=1785 RepID=UPI002BAA6BEC|nr:hypothetical protein [Mycobacterium sp.]HKP39842.1 hypothetical protein [Mycobacterium sp.]